MTTNEIWAGDSLDLINNLPAPIHCILTDPPYGVNYQSHAAVTPKGKAFNRTIENDADLGGALDLFADVFRLAAEHATDPAEAYVFTRWDIVGEWAALLRSLEPETGFKYKALLVWDKGYPGKGDIDACWGVGFELILYLKRGRRDLPYRRNGVISVDRPHNSRLIHVSEKPVPLIEKLIEMSTDPGDWVVDPFSGSGSTSVAAQRMGRNSIGIEKDAQYIEPSRARLSQGAMVF